MKTRNYGNMTIFESEDEMWQAKILNFGTSWIVSFSYDGEWHHFTRRRVKTKEKAILIAQTFIGKK